MNLIPTYPIYYTLAYHFSNGTLSYDNPQPIRTGSRFEVRGPLSLCSRGLHGSWRAIDALVYAPGSIISRTRHSGKGVLDGDKLASTVREHLWVFDASDLLRRFARRCALDVAHLWDAPEVVVQYLKMSDESIRGATWDAAWDAACATRDAAGWSAKDVAHAAWNAAYAAFADYIAKDAARDAADAARRAAWDAQNCRLTDMIHAEAKRLGF